MAFTLVSTQTIIARNAGALYGAVAGSANMTSYVTAAGSNTDAFLNTVYVNSVGNASTASVAKALVSNLGITGDAAMGAESYIVGQLNSVAVEARGAAINSMLSAFANMTDDATFGAAATAWNNKVNNAVTYSTIAGNTDTTFSNVPKVALGQTFTLTTVNNPATGGSDNVSGSAGNDRIVGIMDGGVNADSFSAGDVIDGGDGDDTLSLTIVGPAPVGGAVKTGGIVSNVETISVSNAATASFPIDLTNTTGSKNFNLTTGQDGVTLAVNNLRNIVDVSLAGNGGLTMAYQAATVGGTADAQKVTLNGINPALSTSTSNTYTANGIETMNVTGVQKSSINLAGNALKTINLDGAAEVKLVTAEPTAQTIDASKATGKVTLVATAATGLTKMVGGTADDMLVFGGTLTRNQNIDGGDGKDTLAVGNTAFASDAFTNVKNIEKIALNAASAAVTLDVKSVTGLTEVVSAVTQTADTVTTAQAAVLARAGVDTSVPADGIVTGAEILAYQETSAANAANYVTDTNGAKAGTVTVDNLASGATFTLESSGMKALYETDPTAFDLLGQGAVTLSVSQASVASNTSDSLNLVVNNNSAYTVKNTALGAVNAAKNAYVIDSVTLPNVETVSIESKGTFGGNQISSLAVTAANKLVITGDQNLSIGTGTAAGLDVSNVDSVSLDASALTGKLSVTVDAAELANFSGGLKGGTAADTITVIASLDGQTIDAVTTGFESVLARVSADVTASVDFSGFAGATTKRVTLNAGEAAGDTVTIQGLSNGDTLQLQGTHRNDALVIQGPGSGAALKLDFSQDTPVGAGFTNAGIALTRVGSLEINTTRVDGVDSNLTVAQQATTLGGIDSATLKTLKVTGLQDAANVLSLGAVVNATAGGAALLEAVDLSGFAGSIANAGLVLDTDAGSKGVKVTLNKATAVGTAGTVVAGGAVSGLALGAGADTIVFDSSISANIVINNFGKGVNATVASGIDVLDFRKMGISFADLTFADFANGGGVNAVQITITGTASTIQILGTTSADLNTSNFLFA